MIYNNELQQLEEKDNYYDPDKRGTLARLIYRLRLAEEALLLALKYDEGLGADVAADYFDQVKDENGSQSPESHAAPRHAGRAREEKEAKEKVIQAQRGTITDSSESKAG